MQRCSSCEGWHVIFDALLFGVLFDAFCSSMNLETERSRCDPTDSAKLPSHNDTQHYLYCGLDGMYKLWKCPPKAVFNAAEQNCVSRSAGTRMQSSMALSLPEAAALANFSGVVVAAAADTNSLLPGLLHDGVCGNGFLYNGQPVLCDPKVLSCPAGYSCTQYSVTGVYYCCSGSNTAPSVCGINMTPYLQNSAPVICSPDVPSCPSDYLCLPYSATGVHYCCNSRSTPMDRFPAMPLITSGSRSGVSTNACPRNSYPLVNPISPDQPETCSLPGAPCPVPGYVCRQSMAVSGQLICCSITVHREKIEASTCDFGEALAGVTCSPSVPCRAGYECNTISSNGIPTSFCCPTKSIICTQQLNVGSSSCSSDIVPSQRFYFDAASAVCRAFWYSGCGGNANNFISQKLCGDICVSGMCKYGSIVRAEVIQPGVSPKICSMASDCPEQSLCQDPAYGFPRRKVCCSTAGTMCRMSVVSGNPCHPMDTSTVTRYYFNANTVTCEAFQYAGCGANDNNFMTAIECMSICTNTVCPTGFPMKTAEGAVQTCSLHSSSCPPSYECHSVGTRAICCPAPGQVCSLPINSGYPCSQSPSVQQRWYFNAETRACEGFSYLGCGGNDNRFDSESKCRDICATTTSISLQSRGLCPDNSQPLPEVDYCTINIACGSQPGYVCVASTRNAPVCCPERQILGTCKSGSLQYTKFGSVGMKNPCSVSSPCPPGYTCELSTTNKPICCLMDMGLCPSGEAPLSDMNVCSTADPSSCPSIYQCLSSTSGTPVCCRVDTGTCPDGGNPSIKRGIVEACDEVLRPCVSMNHACVTSTTGQQVCCPLKPQCPSGWNPYFIPGTITPSTCRIGERSSCFGEYQCIAGTSSLSGYGVCCKPAANKVTCPDGSPPYTPPRALIPIQCSVTSNTCPRGYRCTASTAGWHYCCRDNIVRPESPTCPSGRSPYFVPGTVQVQICLESSNCPQGYSCTSSSVPKIALCCSEIFSSGGAVRSIKFGSAQCASGAEAYTFPGTNNPQFCSHQLPKCPTGFSCQPSTIPDRLLCCSCCGAIPATSLLNNVEVQKNLAPSPQATCVGGAAAFSWPGSSRGLACSPHSINPCPSGYSCQQALATNQFICCVSNGDSYVEPLIHAPSVKLKCPYGLHEYYSPVNLIVQECQAGVVGMCPLNFACYRSITFTSRYVCCGLPQAEATSASAVLNSYSRNDFKSVAPSYAGTVVCPLGKEALLTAKGEPLECLLFAPFNCAPSYLCTYNTVTYSSYCCKEIQQTAAQTYHSSAGSNTGYVDEQDFDDEDSIQSDQFQTKTTESYHWPLAARTTVMVRSVENTIPYTGNIPFNGGHLPTSFQTPPIAQGNQSHLRETFNGPITESELVGEGMITSGQKKFDEELQQNPMIEFINVSTQLEKAGKITLINASVSEQAAEKMKNEAPPISKDLLIISSNISKPDVAKVNVNCSADHLVFRGVCLKLLYPGVHGCVVNEQCSTVMPGAKCSEGYCICPNNRLVHGPHCTDRCPSSYANVAGRCHRISAAMLDSYFSDDVKSKARGALGGWCLNTVIPKNQCRVPGAVCSRTRFVCICGSGYKQIEDSCVIDRTLTLNKYFQNGSGLL